LPEGGRPLGKGDALVTKTYDDISYTVNRTIVVDHMHWRD